MGVRGFTTYMSKHTHLFHEYYELKNCYIVLDGSGIAISLYFWHTNSNDVYGGDYDKYASTVHKFFSLLKKCNVTPIILFDGSYESRKMKTVFSRMRSRISSIKKANAGSRVQAYPLFTKELFQDIALSLGVKCIRNDHESDSEVACLGKYLDCPIMGYDSDFYFFDTLYIPFDTFEMRSSSRYIEESKTHEHYISCDVYKIKNFLNHFGGLDETNLPLLPVLLGNDYVKKSLFSAFYKHIKLKKSKVENEQQRLIKTVITWLRNETLESGISKILGRFKANKRRHIRFRLKSAMKGYLQVSSTITEYLSDMGISVCNEVKCDIDILSIKPHLEDGEEEDDSGSSDCEMSEVGSEMSETEISELMIDEEEDELNMNVAATSEELLFISKYRQCFLPQCFGDIKWKNIYFCLPLVENYGDPNSHRISLDILVAIHKILNPSAEKPLTCVLRTAGPKLRKQSQARHKNDLPDILHIQKLKKNESKLLLFEILKIDKTFQEFLDMFPSDWHLFLISLYYWKSKSQKVIDSSYIYSLIICALVLDHIDVKIGSICRSPKAFERRFKRKKMEPSKPFQPSKTIKESFKKVGYAESLLCLNALLSFFCVNPKKYVDKRLNQASIVGFFSEFQSCALHIKYLNSVLCFPFENLMFSKFFCGTFLYNTVVDFRSRSNLKSYLATLLRDCKNFLFSVELIMKNIEQYYGQMCESDAKKRRRRKKKKINTETMEIKESC